MGAPIEMAVNQVFSAVGVFAWCWWVSCGVAKVQFWRRISPLGAPKTHEKSGACPRCATRAGLLRPAWPREAGYFLAAPPPGCLQSAGASWILKKTIKNHQNFVWRIASPGCEHPRARAPHRTAALQLAAGGALVSVFIFFKTAFHGSAWEMHIGICPTPNRRITAARISTFRQFALLYAIAYTKTCSLSSSARIMIIII